MWCKYGFDRTLLILALISLSCVCYSQGFRAQPDIGVYTSCPSQDIIEYCSGEQRTLFSGVLKVMVSSVDETAGIINFLVAKCDDTPFSTSGNLFLEKDFDCDNPVNQVGVAAGATTISISAPLPGNSGNPDNFYNVVYRANTAPGEVTYYYAGEINVERIITNRQYHPYIDLPGGVFDAGITKLRIKGYSQLPNNRLRVTFESFNNINQSYKIRFGSYPNCQSIIPEEHSIPADQIDLLSIVKTPAWYFGAFVYNDEFQVDIDPAEITCISLVPGNVQEATAERYTSTVLKAILSLLVEEVTKKAAEFGYKVTVKPELADALYNKILSRSIENGAPAGGFARLSTVKGSVDRAYAIMNSWREEAIFSGLGNTASNFVVSEVTGENVNIESIIQSTAIDILTGNNDLGALAVEFVLKISNSLTEVYDQSVFTFGYNFPIRYSIEDNQGCPDLFEGVSGNDSPLTADESAPDFDDNPVGYEIQAYLNGLELDYYKVRIKETGELTVRLSQLPRDYSLFLSDGNGEILAYSPVVGTGDEEIKYRACGRSFSFFDRTLEYYIVVVPQEEGSCFSPYKLDFNWEPGAQSCGSNSFSNGTDLEERKSLSGCSSCFDGVQNNQETGVDCGGPDCPSCDCNITVNSIATRCLDDVNLYDIDINLSLPDFLWDDYNMYAYSSTSVVGTTVPDVGPGTSSLRLIENGTDVVVRVERADAPTRCFFEVAVTAPTCDSQSGGCSNPEIGALSPVSGTVFPVGNPITLSWNYIHGTPSCFETFRLQGNSTSNFQGEIILDGVVADNTVTFTPQGPGQLFWRVQGINADGTTGAWSSTAYFSVSSEGNAQAGSPTISPSQLAVSNILTNSLRVDWVRGNGERTLVTCTPCGQFSSDPLDNESYTADRNFEQAESIGNSMTRVLYDGVGNAFTATGLQANTCYRFEAFAFNVDNNAPDYLIGDVPSASETTADNLSLDFEHDPLIIVEDQPVDFDWISSLGGLSIEEWTFQGGTPSSDNTNGDNIVFSSPGIRRVTLSGYFAPTDQWRTIFKDVVVHAQSDFSPDVYFVSSSVSPTETTSEGEVIVSWVAANQGIDEIDLETSDYFLSDDQSLGASDYQFATFNCESSLNCPGGDDNHQERMSADETFSYSRTLELPDLGDDSGVKYILVRLNTDPTATGGQESNLSNNIVAIPLNIIAQLPDLTLSNPSISASTVEAGEAFDLTVTMSNIGNSPVSGCSGFDVYISDDLQLSEDDNDFFTGRYINDGSTCVSSNFLNNEPYTFTRTISTRANLTPGDYFLLLCVDRAVISDPDGNVAEILESNNIISVPITIDGAAQPSAPIQEITITPLSSSSIRVDWVPTSTNTLVVANYGDIDFLYPLDGQTYGSNSSWVSAPQYIDPETNQSIDHTRFIYNGSGNSVVITDLPNVENVYVSAYPYGGTGSEIDYLQGGVQTVLTNLSPAGNDFEKVYKDPDFGRFFMGEIKSIDVDGDILVIGGRGGVVQVSTDGGETFNANKLPNFMDVFAAHIGPQGRIYAGIETGKILFSDDYGINWESVDLSNNIESTFVFDIEFKDSNEGYALTRNQSDNYANLFKTTDGGASWQHQFYYPQKLYSLELKGSEIWMCGFEGFILRSSNGGISFNEVSNDIASGTLVNGIHFVSENVGFLYTPTRLYRTDDAGQTWNSVSDISVNGFVYDYGVRFIDENLGFTIVTSGADRGKVLKTVDGGYSWLEEFTVDDTFPVGVFPTGGHSFTVGKDLHRFTACSVITAYIDEDGDGYGAEMVEVCSLSPGIVVVGGDCNDENSLVNPGMSEFCNGMDDNCNGNDDEPVFNGCGECVERNSVDHVPRINQLNATICSGDQFTLTITVPTGSTPNDFIWSTGEVGSSIMVSPNMTTDYTVSHVSGLSECSPSVTIFVDQCVTCDDGLQNGDETGVDCGGSSCPVCPVEPSVLATVYLEGAYDESTGAMRDAWRSDGLITSMEPFTFLGYQHRLNGGQEEISNPNAVLADFGANSIVSWILLELRSGNNIADVVASRSALITGQGNIVATDGVSLPSFGEIPPGSYYLVVRHLNHLGVATAQPIEVTESTLFIAANFRDGSQEAYGSGALKALPNGKMAIKAGDANGDGQINAIDANAYWRLYNGTSAAEMILSTDFNMDGVINAIDLNALWRVNNSQSVQFDYNDD